MLELWIPITIGAALLQSVRSAAQKRLTEPLGVLGATYVRFAYGLPFAGLYLVILWFAHERTLPAADETFFVYAVTGGLAQILATALLIYSLSLRNFAAANTYAKTETIQTALVAFIILGETLNGGAAAGVVISLIGVIALSSGRMGAGLTSVLSAWREKSAYIGLAVGAIFAVSATSYRAASLSLGDADVVLRAGYTLLWVIAIQTLVMTVYFIVRKRAGILRATLSSWRGSLLAGFTGAAASVGWFTAMAMEPVAHVRALGQIELIFALVLGFVLFRERVTGWEMAGMALTVAGLVLLILAT